MPKHKEIMKTLTAKINTKSNFRNLNGQFLEVREIKGRRVTCICKNEFGNNIYADFSINEISEFGEYTFPAI